MMYFLRLRVIWFVVLSALSILTMVFSTTISVSFFRNIIFDSSNVFRNIVGQSAILIENVSEKFVARKVMQVENDKLKKEIRRYKENLKIINSLVFENEMLQRILEFSLSIDYDLLPTQILSINGEGKDIQSVLVDRGSVRGVEKNMAVVGVYNNDLVVVGLISNVTFYAAQFTPITHVNFSVPAQTNQSMQKGILSGYDGQENLLLFTSDAIYENNSDFIFVGEQIVVNTYSKFLPRGMLVGVVVKVSSSGEDRISRAYIRPYVMLSKLDYVFIVIPKEPEPDDVKNESATTNTATQ